MEWGRATSTLMRVRLDGVLNRAVGSPIMVARGPRGCGMSTAIIDWLKRYDPEQKMWSCIDLDAFDASVRIHDDSCTADDAFRIAKYRELFESHYARNPVPESHLLVLQRFGTKHEPFLMPSMQEVLEAHEGRRFIVITHELLEFERMRAVLPIEISVVPPQEFSFTADEARAYLGGSLLEDLAAELTEEFDGSIALLRIARMRVETMDPGFFAKKAFKPIANALNRKGAKSSSRALAPETQALFEVITAAVRDDVQLLIEKEKLGVEELEFFATIAVPNVIDQRLLGLLYPETHGDWLADLEARGLIHRTVCNRSGDFLMNPLYRQVLQEKFLSRPEEKLRELRIICARFELEYGSAYQALNFALQAEDYQLASNIIRLHADEYLEGELGQRGAGLLDKLSMSVLLNYPLLAMSLAIAYSSTGKFKFKTLELLALAATGAHTLARKAPVVDRFIMTMIESCAMRLSGFGDVAVRTARVGLRLYKEMTPSDRDAIGRFEGSILVQLSLSLHSGAAMGEAFEALELGIAAEGKTNSAQNGNYAGTVLAYYYALEGNMRKASVQLQESFPEYWSDPERIDYFATPFRLASCFCAMEEQRFDDARGWIQLILKGQGSNEFWPAMRMTEAMLSIMDGETSSSMVRLQGFLSRDHEQPVVQKTGRQMLNTAASLLSLATGDIGNALRMTQKSEGPEAKNLLQARIRLAQGDAKEALRLSAAAGNPVSPRRRFEKAVVTLAALLQLNDHTAIGDAMRMVDALNKEFGLAVALNFLPAPDLERVQVMARTMDITLPVGQDMIAPLPGGLGRVVLSERELAIMHELVTTSSAAEIAERQFVSVNTVKSQLKSAYKKLGVSDRDAALAAAHVQGLLAQDIESDDDAR